MIDKIRNAIAPLFEEVLKEERTEQGAYIKNIPIFIWAGVCGAIGGVATFVVHTSHPFAASIAVSFALLILTCKSFFKYIVHK